MHIVIIIMGLTTNENNRKYALCGPYKHLLKIFDYFSYYILKYMAMLKCKTINYFLVCDNHSTQV